MKDALEYAKTPERQKELALKLLEGSIGLEDDQISYEMRGDFLEIGFKLLGDLPLVRCAYCRGPLFTHESVTIEGKLYHKTCAINAEE